MRMEVGEFATHIRQQIGSQQFPSKNKQALIFDAEGHRVGFLNQYNSRSFTVYFNERLDGSSNLQNNPMQVRNLLTRMVPGGHVEWQ